MNFADRLVESIVRTNNHSVVGLDPRIEQMPEFIVQGIRKHELRDEMIRHAVADFHRLVISTICDLIPAVKLQIAFYEQYGLPGLLAFSDTIAEAKKHDLIVMVDAKRNDISSTAQAYANSFLGETDFLGKSEAVYNVDAITVNPYMGRDSIMPFVETCKAYDKGIFILVKTSNSGSTDFQDLQIAEHGHAALCDKVAELVSELGQSLVGNSGYSSVGAVVGATYPDEACRLRKLMPHAYFLVPGYGAQGGRAEDIAPCFNRDRLGAVVNASRSITYDLNDRYISSGGFCDLLRERTIQMRHEINEATQSFGG